MTSSWSSENNPIRSDFQTFEAPSKDAVIDQREEIHNSHNEKVPVSTQNFLEVTM